MVKPALTPETPESKQAASLNVHSTTPANIKLFRRLELHTPPSAPPLHVPVGLQSFYLLSLLRAHDPLRGIKVPATFLLNCGFKKNPQHIYTEASGRLVFSPVEGARNLKELALASLQEQANQAGVQMPVAVLKFNKGKKLVKWILMNLKDLSNQWPEFDTDSVIQQYIVPKGLQASKTRVFLKNNAVSVFKWTSNIRMDSKSDFRPQKQRLQTKSLSSTQTLEFTVLNHRRILKAIEAQSFESVTTTLDKSQLLMNDSEARHIFELFKHSPTEQKRTEAQSQVDSSLTSRYTTHNDPKRSEVHKCNPGSYELIVEQTRALKGVVEKGWLRYRTRIEEMAVDFVQDTQGEWYFLGIKRVVLGEKTVFAATKQLARFSKCEGQYCKLPEDQLALTLSQHSQSDVLLSKLGCKEFHEVSDFINRSQQLHKIPKKQLGMRQSAEDMINVHSYDVALVCTLCYYLYAGQPEDARALPALRSKSKSQVQFVEARRGLTRSFLGA